MDVLVFGGTGFVGRYLCRTLRDRGHSVTAVGRAEPGDAFPEDVSFVQGDVTDYDTLPPVMADRDAVAHLVSLSPLYKPPGGARDHELVTVGGTRNIVRAMNEADVDRMLYLSALDADPDGPTAFIRTKGRAEAIVTAAELEWTIIRPSVIFGPGAEFISFTRQVTTPFVTGLPSGGQIRFQPIWVEDLAEMMAMSLEDDEHVGEVYEVGGPEVLTLADVTKLVHRAAGRPVRILPVPMPLARVALTVAGVVPLIPFGPDQYRSLQFDNTIDENDAPSFGREEGELRSFRAYLSDEASSGS